MNYEKIQKEFLTSAYKRDAGIGKKRVHILACERVMDVVVGIAAALYFIPKERCYINIDRIRDIDCGKIVDSICSKYSISYCDPIWPTSRSVLQGDYILSEYKDDKGEHIYFNKKVLQSFGIDEITQHKIFILKTSDNKSPFLVSEGGNSIGIIMPVRRIGNEDE